MKRLLLMTLVLLCSLSSYADNDGEFLTEIILKEQPTRSFILYPAVSIESGVLDVYATQSDVHVRVFTDGAKDPVLSLSSYDQVAIDLDELQPGTYTLVIDVNNHQFEATFVVFTIE